MSQKKEETRAATTTMIFEPELRIPVPTKDVLSFIFDEPRYDQDQPVSLAIWDFDVSYRYLTYLVTTNGARVAFLLDT